jgi:hypothetical protein
MEINDILWQLIGFMMLATVYTTVGKTKVVDRIDGTQAGSNTDYIGWGTGAGTAAVGDTTLFTEASESRVAATKSQPAADTNQWVATMTADGAKTITNAGVFDASTSGNLIVKGDFTGIALVLNDQIQFTVTLQQT